MVETIFRGPAYSGGAMLDNRVEAMDGPGLEYQANGFPDVRFGPTKKDGMYPGRVQAFLNSPFTVLSDNTPSAVAPAGLAAAANAVNGTPVTLVTVAPGGSGAGVPSLARVPIIPFGVPNAAPVIVSAMDFGFTTGNTTAGSTTIPVPDSSLFALGEWICIGGAGNSAKTASLMTQVVALPTATSIQVSSAFPPLGTLTNAPIGRTNLTMGALAPPQAYPAGIPVQPTGVLPYSTAGLALIMNPVESLARCVSITGSTSATGGTFIVRGYDNFDIPMSENITVGAGAVTKYGNKAFKYLLSVTPQFSDAHTYSVGWGDTFGFNIRSDKWEFANIFYNGAFVTAQTGWAQALQPPSGPSTATNADVRGTVQVSANGNNTGTGGSGISGGTPTTGAIRLMLATTVPLYNNIFGTPVNPVPMFGLPQFTQ